MNEQSGNLFLAVAAVLIACMALVMAVASYAQVRDLRQMIGG